MSKLAGSVTRLPLCQSIPFNLLLHHPFSLQVSVARNIVSVMRTRSLLLVCSLAMLCIASVILSCGQSNESSPASKQIALPAKDGSAGGGRSAKLSTSLIPTDPQRHWSSFETLAHGGEIVGVQEQL